MDEDELVRQLNGMHSDVEELTITIDRITDQVKRETAAFSARTKKELAEIKTMQLESFGRDHYDIEFSARFYAKGKLPEKYMH